MAYMAATGVDKDDPDTVDLDKIMKERTYIEALDPALRELLLNFLAQSGGSVDTAKLFETIYAAKNEEYVEYAVEKIHESGLFTIVPWHEDSFFYPKTDFQIQWEAEGKAMHRIRCQKQG
jgi:hypothetical protein